MERLLVEYEQGLTPEQILSLARDANQRDLAESIKRMKYSDFMRTPYWWAVSCSVKNRDKRCRICATNASLQVHHSTYEHHGCEHDHMDDLISLCPTCHKIFHVAKKNPFIAKEIIFKNIDVNVSKENTKRKNERKSRRKNKSKVGPANWDIRSLITVTRSNFRELVARKESWHWFVENGYNPQKSGWKERLIGRSLPPEFFNKPERMRDNRFFA